MIYKLVIFYLSSHDSKRNASESNSLVDTTRRRTPKFGLFFRGLPSPRVFYQLTQGPSKFFPFSQLKAKSVRKYPTQVKRPAAKTTRSFDLKRDAASTPTADKLPLNRSFRFCYYFAIILPSAVLQMHTDCL